MFPSIQKEQNSKKNYRYENKSKQTGFFESVHLGVVSNELNQRIKHHKKFVNLYGIDNASSSTHQFKIQKHDKYSNMEDEEYQQGNLEITIAKCQNINPKKLFRINNNNKTKKYVLGFKFREEQVLNKCLGHCLNFQNFQRPKSQAKLKAQNNLRLSLPDKFFREQRIREILMEQVEDDIRIKSRLISNTRKNPALVATSLPFRIGSQIRNNYASEFLFAS